MSEVIKKKKIKRALNRRFLALLCIILLAIISLFKIPDFITTRALEDLGFSSEAIKAIKAKNLDKRLIDGKYYSEYLDSEVQKDNFKSDYLELYVWEDSLSDDDFLLYDKLVQKGYSEDAVINLFKELNFNELTPLLVFDNLDSTANYIADCIKNRATNVDGNFHLDGDYLHPYTNINEAKDLNKDTVLVTQKYTLNEYIPQKLVPLTVEYAAEGVELANSAYTAFITMSDAMNESSLYIYAVTGYRSYTDQTELYESYASEEEADQNTPRPGHSETQTGLSVVVVDSANESLSNFVNTGEYTWLKDHAHEYGFIIRYPEGKSSITGYEFTPYQLRYVGTDVATAVYESGLTYEEYYLLYLDNTSSEEAK